MPTKMKRKGGGLKVKKAKLYGGSTKPTAMKYGIKKKKKKKK
tara:strand:+ start:7911 stop:8036 length:126 start_codon:yes stop_codon:yes gene_type:complete